MNIPLQLVIFSLPSIIYVAVNRLRGEKWNQVFERVGWQSSSPGYYFWSLGVTILLGGLGWLAVQFIPQNVLQDANVSISKYAGWTPGIASFLLILLREAIYVTLGEEIFFRGLLGGWLIRRFGFIIGNTAQALMFLVPHLLLLLVNIRFWPIILVQFLAGWFLGWLRFRSNSILPGWLVHSLSNTWSALAIIAR